MFSCQSVEGVTLKTQLLVKVSELGLARKLLWVHGLDTGEVASGAVEVDAEMGCTTACVAGRVGRYSGPVCPHPARFNMLPARAIVVNRIWLALNIVKL